MRLNGILSKRLCLQQQWNFFVNKTRSFFFLKCQMEFNTNRTGLVNATKKEKKQTKNMALVDLYLYSVLMQCLTWVSTGEKRSNPTSPMTSSDMTIKRQWRSGSESGQFPPRVGHLWFIKLVQQNVPTSSLLHRKTSVILCFMRAFHNRP